MACVGACGSAAAPAPSTSTQHETVPEPAAAPVLISDRSKSPAACAPKVVAAKIDAMFAVMDTGRVEELTDLLDTEPLFAWYSMTAGVGLKSLWHVVGRTPAAARAIFERRQAVSEHARLVALRMRFDADNGRANLEPVFRYSADDLASGRPRYGAGKAVFTCRTGRLRVWSGAIDARAATLRRTVYCGFTSAQLRRRAEALLGPVVCAERLR
jgi:hypothetical protein